MVIDLLCRQIHKGFFYQKQTKKQFGLVAIPVGSPRLLPGWPSSPAASSKEPPTSRGGFRAAAAAAAAATAAAWALLDIFFLLVELGPAEDPETEERPVPS